MDQMRNDESTSMSAIELYIPTEIYANIISQFKTEAELVFLWTVLRNVSRMMQDLVDAFVRHRHLPKTHIIPDLCMSSYMELNWSRKLFDPELTTLSYFSHISEQDPTLAIFKIAPHMPLEQRQSLTSNRGFSIGAIREESWARPRAVVAVRRLANDTELPRAHWDDTTCELSLDWRGMFGALLWEEKLRIHLSKQWVQRAKALKAEALANSTSGNANNAIMRMVLAQRGARDESVSQARQKRIRRQMQRTEPGSMWVPTREDIEFFEIVEQLQQVANGWDFDDL